MSYILSEMCWKSKFCIFFVDLTSKSLLLSTSQELVEIQNWGGRKDFSRDFIKSMRGGAVDSQPQRGGDISLWGAQELG